MVRGVVTEFYPLAFILSFYIDIHTYIYMFLDKQSASLIILIDKHCATGGAEETILSQM